jgi:two-component system response regulator CpxR
VISGAASFTSGLRRLLLEQGFQADVFANPAQGLDVLRSEPRSLVILDETSPSESGYEILRKLRTRSRSPVLMVLRWDTPEARIASLEAGADDCIGRPYHPRELTARVKSILRRSEPNAALHAFEANGILVDISSREVFFEGNPIQVTTVEFDILAALIRSAGRTVSRDELMEALYRRKATPFDRSIDMHVSHLRRKFAGKPDLIKTVRGEGYQLSLPWQESFSQSAS